MKKDSVFSEELKGLIEEPGGPVTADGLVTNTVEAPATDMQNYSPEWLSAYQQYITVSDNSLRLRTVLGAWKAQNEQERNMRSKYAKWLIGILLGQFILGDFVLFLIGTGNMHLSQWVANTFFATTTAQIVSLALLVLRYLFPQNTSDRVLEIVQRL